jgi:hypothetical protein
MGIEVIHHEGNAFGLGVVHIDSVANLLGPVYGRALVGDFQVTPALQRFEETPGPHTARWH